MPDSSSSSSSCHWLLSDRALTPILSSAPFPTSSDARPSKQSQAQLQSLTSLSTTAITAFESASRLGLGIPQRIIVETHSPAPVILHSFLHPPAPRRPIQYKPDQSGERGILEQARDELRPLTATTDAGSDVHEGGRLQDSDGLNNSSRDAALTEEDEEGFEPNTQQSLLLVASIIAPNITDARKAAASLERTGKEIQRELALERQRQAESHDAIDRVEDG